MSPDREVLVERFRTTMRLHEEGVRLMRQNLRRRYPRAGEVEIERRLAEWLSERPGAEFGDGVGKPGGWPRG
jgi:hypothetical protein